MEMLVNATGSSNIAIRKARGLKKTKKTKKNPAIPTAGRNARKRNSPRDFPG